MFPFSAKQSIQPTPEVTENTSKVHDPHPLDQMTGGAFSAATSSERTARIREWLSQTPDTEQMQAVFKELSAKDKGAARLLREKLDEIKRSKGQELIAKEWADKAHALLALSKLNIADAMAWQRDAAKAGAPLSKEPLSVIKVELSERVKIIEDLQHRVQVQREAAVLLAQRIEVLSTKSWRDAQALQEALQLDVEHWQAQAAALLSDTNWPSVDVKFPPLLEASQGQLLVVWAAFRDALAQAVLAATDVSAALPPVPVWSDELRAARGALSESAPRPKRPAVDPELKAKAQASVDEALTTLEQEISQGHGKASTGAANALRQALKEFGWSADDKLEARAHAALAAAGELEGWQRWRADQLREELVQKAQALLNRPEGQAIGGRKMQESLRGLREQWKLTDQGGVPNHGLWKRFDEACNEAHKVVEVWLEKLKAEAAEHRQQRLALIDELNAWAEKNRSALDDDWKGFSRILHQFGERWRDAGHVGEKMFAELQPLWKAAMQGASAPLELLQKDSLATRHALIEEAKVLGAAPVLRIDAVKDLQRRWQSEAHRVPIDRRQEQKLWDAFRKPIDDAFNRKTQERQKADAALGERDRIVLEAAKALEAANQAGDAHAIRSAMQTLEAALRGQAQAQAALQAADAEVGSAASAQSGGEGGPMPHADQGSIDAGGQQVQATAESGAPAKIAPKPVRAVRGDDRPGMKKSEPAAPMRPGKFGERKDGARDGGQNKPRGPREAVASMRSDDRFARRSGRDAATGAPAWRTEAPRLGESAFRAQRDAVEHAQLALRRLAAQAHGEALTQILTAWEQRDPSRVPSVQEFGNRITPAIRNTWLKSLAQAPTGDAGVALLRLEMASEMPTPVEHLNARRVLQLQLLTRRHDPSPLQTWAQDAALVLASTYEAAQGRRFQNALKVLLRSS